MYIACVERLNERVVWWCEPVWCEGGRSMAHAACTLATAAFAPLVGFLQGTRVTQVAVRHACSVSVGGCGACGV
eukprot:361632-Chlamydomonas_euryale.AAC.1